MLEDVQVRSPVGRRQRQDELELTCAEIERILGAMLPKSASLPQWWANTTDPHTSQVPA